MHALQRMMTEIATIVSEDHHGHDYNREAGSGGEAESISPRILRDHEMTLGHSPPYDQ